MWWVFGFNKTRRHSCSLPNWKEWVPRNKSQIYVNFSPEKSSIFKPKAPTHEEVTKNLIIKKGCDYPFYKSGENVDHLCARGDAMEKGDSGGPMMLKNRQTNQYIIVGIVSRGNPHEYVMEYVFTKVASFRPWILKQMQFHGT